MTVRKEEQNANLNEINTLTNPKTKTIIDRYVFASNFCKGQSVLDVPSGHGYGGMIMRGLGATSVHCLDIDEAALTTMKQYNDITCEHRDMTKRWNVTKQYDAVVSIEGFEHIEREDVPMMLENIKKSCKPGGTIFITTPRRKMDVWDYNGGTHCYEYDYDEFKKELTNVFNYVTIGFALEFRITDVSQELNTIFSLDKKHKDTCHVFVATIQND